LTKDIDLTSPFPIRGVIEGFYGLFYTAPERNDLIRFLGANGYNLYIYAPKNDRPHRNRWREAYPPKIMAQFAETAATAREAGVEFCYALSPGGSICYSDPVELERVQEKLRAVYRLGIHAFSLLLDDIRPDFRHSMDGERFECLAGAQADLCNRTLAWLKDLDPDCTLSMCPTEYSGSAPFSAYLHELGARLDPEIAVFYTGPETCSRTIGSGDAADFSRALRRRPLIWDNYPVNDLGMAGEMHIGPIAGRDPDLAAATRGIVVNLMIQAEASKIPLLTYADFLACPQGYRPKESWRRALAQVGGEESLEALSLFAETSAYSCLVWRETGRLDALALDLGHAIASGEPVVLSLEFHHLRDYLNQLDEACFHLLYRMENLALRNNLVPWVQLLDLWQRVGSESLDILAALETGTDFVESRRLLVENLAAAKKHPCRVAGEALVPLAEYGLHVSSS
jgi:hyaluronoglucosaminidase